MLLLASGRVGVIQRGTEGIIKEYRNSDHARDLFINEISPCQAAHGKRSGSNRFPNPCVAGSIPAGGTVDRAVATARDATPPTPRRVPDEQERTDTKGLNMAGHAGGIAGGGPTGMMLAAELGLAKGDGATGERRPGHVLADSRAGGV